MKGLETKFTDDGGSVFQKNMKAFGDFGVHKGFDQHIKESSTKTSLWVLFDGAKK